MTDLGERLATVGLTALLAAFLLLQGPLAGRVPTPSDPYAVCERQGFLSTNYFFLAFH
jgi:hypothetical protein